MKVALFGATGYIGGAILEKALAAGYSVRALVRNPGKLSATVGPLETLEGDLSNHAKISETIEGTQAVIWAIGATRNKNDQVGVYAEAMQGVLASMRANKCNRLLVLSGAGLVVPNEKSTFKRRTMQFMLRLFLPRVLETNRRVFEILLENKNIDWTVVRPAYIPKGAPTGRIRSDPDGMVGTKIDVADLAQFFVERIGGRDYVHQAPFVASGK